MVPPFFASLSAKTLLQPPPAPSRKPSQRLQRPANELDDFLSSDLENSFASSMSLNSPPHSPERNRLAPSSLSNVQSPMAMDISPAPRQGKVNFNDDNERKLGFRGFSGARSFGRELGNHALASSQPESASMRAGGKGLQRSAIPSEWLAGFSPAKVEHIVSTFQSRLDDPSINIRTAFVFFVLPYSSSLPMTTSGLSSLTPWTWTWTIAFSRWS